MLTIQAIRDNEEEIIARLGVKFFDAKDTVSQLLSLDDKRKTLQADLNNLQSEMNALSKEIGILFKEKKIDEANKAKEKTSEIKESVKSIEAEHQVVSTKIDTLLVQIPNVPHSSVPKGKTADDNEFIRSFGELPPSEGKVPHWELTKQYDIIDFELGNKIAGAGFPLYKGKGAKLQRALINFFLDEAEKAGYTEFMPPIVVNEESGFGTGQLPDKEGQMYHVTEDNLYLIPTAEVPITNIFRDVIVNASEFPIKCTAYTPCFRREAGSYGKDVRGLNRLHQFDKVEIVRVEHPDNSYAALDEMVCYVESLVRKLELPYRIVKLCGGDMSFTSAMTYDFEVYSAAQERWLEISSVSNFEAYQANRLKLRFKEDGQKKSVLAHTLNGSALALPRIVAALLENNQTQEGIKIPESLVPYTGFSIIN